MNTEPQIFSPNPEVPHPNMHQAPSHTEGDQSKILAALSYVWILSLIMLLVKKDSAFVRFHARQGFVLFLGEVILGFIPFIPFIGWIFAFFINWIFWLLLLVLSLIGIVGALQGKSTKLPFVYNWSQKVNL